MEPEITAELFDELFQSVVLIASAVIVPRGVLARILIDAAVDDEIQSGADIADLFEESLQDTELRGREDHDGVVGEELRVSVEKVCRAVSGIISHGGNVAGRNDGSISNLAGRPSRMLESAEMVSAGQRRRRCVGRWTVRIRLRLLCQCFET